MTGHMDTTGHRTMAARCTEMAARGGADRAPGSASASSSAPPKPAGPPGRPSTPYRSTTSGTAPASCSASCSKGTLMTTPDKGKVSADTARRKRQQRYKTKNLQPMCAATVGTTSPRACKCHAAQGSAYCGAHSEPSDRAQAAPAAVAGQTLTGHRGDHWEFIEHLGVPSVRDPLLRLREVWDDANRRWFATAMIAPYIMLATPSGSRTLGETAPVGSFGEKLEIRLRPSLLDGTHPKVHGSAAGCFLFVADVLLHEMIHQWGHEAMPLSLS
jgi:hypothetical protein